MNPAIKKLGGANMDIDLATPGERGSGEQERRRGQEAAGADAQRGTVKDVSICPYFCGVEYLDSVLCCYPWENPLRV